MTNFELGHVVATRGVFELVYAGKVDAAALMQRHINCDWGDWGDLCASDKRLNDRSLKPGHEGRLFSSYPIGDQIKVWVITEWDRSVTTLLLPSEY